MLLMFLVFSVIAMIIIVLAKATYMNDKKAAENLAGLCMSPLILVGVTAWIMSLFSNDDPDVAPAVNAFFLLIFMGIGAAIGTFFSAMADSPFLRHMGKWCLGMGFLGYVVGIFVLS